MVKPKAISDKEQVTAHIEKLDVSIGKTVELIRKIILESDKEVGERIKWNNPSFYYMGKMKEFDPKEYKREICVMNLHKNRLMLVFPCGVKLDDKFGLLEGDYKDGRRLLIFKDIDDVKKKKVGLQNLVKNWLTFVER